MTFYIQAFALVPLALCFMATPSKYFAFQNKKEEQARDAQGNFISSQSAVNQYSNLEHYESSLNKRQDGINTPDSQSYYSHAINGS